MAGAVLLLLWLFVANLLLMRRQRPVPVASAGPPDDARVVHHLLLDALPIPLVLVAEGAAHTMNRAARLLFSTDDRILPPPASILHRDTTHLRYAARNWRVDRVQIGARSVVALIDVESEERSAEARASAELIQVLGHEMLNGLVPIVSLAECGIAAAEVRDDQPALLPEILTTLARRAEGLQRFIEAYRELARLPPPMRQTVSIVEMVDDLSRLFVSQWREVRLSVVVEAGLYAEIDRDQMSQALWALLQNAVEAIEQGFVSTGEVNIQASASDALLVIEVSDNGPGVPPERAHAVFRPFYTSKSDGSGIGLSLARQIVQAHGGTLTLVHPSPTTLRAQIPIAPI